MGLGSFGVREQNIHRQEGQSNREHCVFDSPKVRPQLGTFSPKLSCIFSTRGCSSPSPAVVDGGEREKLRGVGLQWGARIVLGDCSVIAAPVDSYRRVLNRMGMRREDAEKRRIVCRVERVKERPSRTRRGTPSQRRPPPVGIYQVRQSAHLILSSS